MCLSLCVWDLMSGKNKTRKMKRDCLTTAVISAFGFKFHKPTLYTTHIGENLTTAVKLEPLKRTVFKKKPPCTLAVDSNAGSSEVNFIPL